VTRINRMAGRPIQTRGKPIYKTTEMVDGRLVSRYSDHKPVSGDYEILSR